MNYQYEYPVGTVKCTLSYGNGEEINCTSSDVRICISECLYKCGDSLSVKYLVPKALCEYSVWESRENNGAAP